MRAAISSMASGRQSRRVLKGIDGVGTRHDGKLIGEAKYGNAAAMVCPTNNQEFEEIIATGKPDKVIVSGNMVCHLDVSSTTDPFYFLAPTDAAFAALPKEQRDALLNDPQAITKLLKAHFVPGFYPAGSMSGAVYNQTDRVVTNLLGQKLHVLGGTVNNLQKTGLSYTVGNGNRLQILFDLLPVQ